MEVIPTNDHFRESSASPILEEDSQAEELVMEAQGMYITSISNNCVSRSFKPYHTLTGDKYKFPSLFSSSETIRDLHFLSHRCPFFDTIPQSNV